MKIFQINPKIGVLPKESKTNLDILLKRMKAGRNFSRNDSRFSDSRIVRCELIDKDAILINDEFTSNGKTEIIIKNNEYVIDNKNGEVTLKTNLLNYIFMSSRITLKKVESLINTIEKNFDNSAKVQQCRLVIEGFSRESIERLRQSIENYQKNQHSA